MTTTKPLALALAALAVSACAGARARKGPDVLAEVNGERITTDDLQGAFTKRHGGHEKFLAGEVEVRKFLDRLVERQLLVQEAYRIGLDRKEDIQKAEAEAVVKEAIRALAKAEVEARAEPTDADVKAIWETKLEELVQVRQLVVPTEAEAKELAAKLAAGGDLEALARERSLSPSAKYGGRVAPLGWGAMDERWEAAVAALAEKERSAPFEGPDGWEIVEVESRVAAPRPEYAKAEGRIRAVLRDRRVRARDAAFVAELKERWHARAAELDASIASLRAAREARSTAPALSWDGGAVTLGELAARLDLDALSSLAPDALAAQVRKMADAALVDGLLRAEVARRGLDRSAAALAAGVERREELMENHLVGEYVLQGVAVSGAEVRAYFDAHPDEFVTPERRRVAHVLVETREQAEAAAAKLAGGTPFAEVARSDSKDDQTKKTGGDLGFVEKTQVPPGLEAVLDVHEGDTTAPVQSKLGWHVFKVTKIVPATPQAFDEVKDELGKKLLQKARTARRTEWIEKLRGVSKIRVNDAAVKRLAAAQHVPEIVPPVPSPAAHGMGGR